MPIRYAWPGNVRELENIVYRAVLLTDEPVIAIGPHDHRQKERRRLVDRRQPPFEGLDYSRAKEMAIEDFERKFLTSLLAKSHGNVTEAARMAGTERRHLGKLLRKFGIPRDEFRE
jgi:two-component system response regulator GlrR